MKSQCWVIAGNQILKSEYFQIHVAVIKRKNGRKHVYLDEGPTGYCRPVHCSVYAVQLKPGDILQ